MTRFRSRRPPPQLVRASTIQKSSHEVAVHWWRYRHHFLGSQAGPARRAPAAAGDRQPARGHAAQRGVAP